MSDKDHCNAAFEQWAREQGMPGQRTVDGGTYTTVTMRSAWDAWQAALAYRCEQASQGQGTPGSRWAAEGQPDPHGDIYNCERAALTMGDLTDDELANAAFLNYDRWPRLEDVIAGKAHPPIAYMTAVKERIRWLSRRLSEQASQGQWIPVSERLPEAGKFVLINDNRFGASVGYYKDGAWYEPSGYEFANPRTHWMPLPAAPIPHKEGT